MVYSTSSNHNLASGKSRIAPAPTSIPLNSQGEFASRHMRLNRMLRRKRRVERRKPSALPKILLLLIILCIVLVIIASGTAGGTYAYYQSQLHLLDDIAQHSLFQTTHIYDRNGNLLYELYDTQEGNGRRTYINYQDISPLLIDATISAEDHTFWSNSGVDYTSIVRAAVINMQNNEVVEGGSTITQQ